MSTASQDQLRLTPEEVKTARSILATRVGSSGNPLVKEVVIRGDPSRPGLYTVLLHVNHFAMTRGPVVVAITGYGPSGVTFFDPSHPVKETHQ